MAKDPAVLFYYTDFMNGTKRMTFDQKGLYIELLCEQCDSETGSIPEEDFDFIVKPYENTYGLPYAIKVLSKFEKDSNGFFNSVMRVHINKRKNYTEGRKKNLKGTNVKTHMKPHMENENENEDENINVIETEDVNVININKVKEYFEFQGSLEFADDFYNHYEAQGWVTGSGRKIINWKYKADQWIKRELDKPKGKYDKDPRGTVDVDKFKREAATEKGFS